MMTQTRWLTRAEAAVRADCDVRTIDRWLRTQRLTRWRLMGRVFVDAHELNQLLEPKEEK